MGDYLVIDLETQKSFDDVGGRAYPHLLKISVAGVYSYKKDKYFALEESELSKLEEMIKESELVIGFNTKYFDYLVLEPYLKEVKIKDIPSCDIMEDVANVLGHRLSLDSLAKATLHTKKSGHGLDAIRYWNEGNMKDLKSYCLDDVRITRDIFDYGRKYKELFYNEKGSEVKLSVPVYWEEYDKDFKNRVISDFTDNNEENIKEENVNEEINEEKDSKDEDIGDKENYSLF